MTPRERFAASRNARSVAAGVTVAQLEELARWQAFHDRYGRTPEIDFPVSGDALALARFAQVCR